MFDNAQYIFLRTFTDALVVHCLSDAISFGINPKEIKRSRQCCESPAIFPITQHACSNTLSPFGEESEAARPDGISLARIKEHHDVLLV